MIINSHPQHTHLTRPTYSPHQLTPSTYPINSHQLNLSTHINSTCQHTLSTHRRRMNNERAEVLIRRAYALTRHPLLLRISVEGMLLILLSTIEP